MSIDWTLIIEIIYFLNVILAIITVFRQPRDIAAIWAWLLVLLLLPVVGFIMYAFVGRQLPKNKLFRVKSHVQMQLDERLQQQRDAIGNEDLPADLVSNSERALVQMFKTSDQPF